MLDVMTRIRQLHRPALLVRAARFGLDHYRRDAVLRRLLKTDKVPRPAAAVMALLSREATINARRLSGKGDYSMARHVELLIAINAEARLLIAATPRAL
ncbi:DUF6477 family protein [Yoonia sp.]|uniref:DUF6477 family protein n=1 Tax=Yoonia sp. TaxID=2212373 RepID=UPI00391AE35F